MTEWVYLYCNPPLPTGPFLVGQAPGNNSIQEAKRMLAEAGHPVVKIYVVR